MTKPFPRGKSYYQGQTIDANNLPGVHLEGQDCVFLNTDPSTTINRRNQGDVRAIIVRNTSGITLSAKRVVKWASGYRGRRVDGYANVDHEEVAGVVDDHVGSGGVQANDLFWLIVEGECLIQTPMTGAGFNGDVAVGDILTALTAAASTGTTAGRFQRWNGTFTATQTTDGTLGNILANRFARAMSAKTTGNTNSDILVDLYKV